MSISCNNFLLPSFLWYKKVAGNQLTCQLQIRRQLHWKKKGKKYSIINNSFQDSLLKKLSFFLYILKPLQTCVNCNTLQGYTLVFWMEESDLIIQEFLKAFLVLALCCCYICLRKTLIGLGLQTYNFKKAWTIFWSRSLGWVTTSENFPLNLPSFCFYQR